MANSPRTHLINQSALYRLTRRQKLANLLHLTDAELRSLTKYCQILYRETDIPKKSGEGTRHIENPAKILKKVQSRIATLLSRIDPPDFLFCPVKRRCYVTNAAQHHGNRVVKTLDIKNYFPSTSSKRVYWFFSSVMQCNKDIAETITQLATFREHLPTGSPLSPIMAFFAHYDMWNDIAEICTQNGCKLTVYIDDVTVSGEHVPESLMWDIKKKIHSTGHQYHKEKAFFDKSAEVTGVFVSQNGISVPNKQFRKLRLNLKAAKAAGDNQNAKAQQKLAGLQGQVAQIKKVADFIRAKRG
jgi:retron-type reverse transcriptase